MRYIAPARRRGRHDRAASECVVAGELGLAYAAVCVVDNYANGVAATELTLEEVEAGQRAHRAKLAEVLAAVIPALA